MNPIENFHVGLVQADTQFANADGNLAYLEESLENHSGADLYLLPELFNTGYRNAFTLPAEPMGGKTCRWMSLMAGRKKAAICGSVSILEGGKVFNRFILAEPGGGFQWYDKVNVFAFSGEDKVFSAGQNFPLFNYLGWKIKPTVCFDLRFPETLRNREPYYHLILCSAHWPEPRIQAWDKLIPARAIENQAFFAAVNRIGKEDAHIYPGHSTLADFLGNPILEPIKKEGIRMGSLNFKALMEFRSAFPFLKAEPDYRIPSTHHQK
jgi:predicted amidohydrolase